MTTEVLQPRSRVRNILTLDREETAYLYHSNFSGQPEGYDDPATVFNQVWGNIAHASLVMPMVGARDALGIRTLEKMVGRPIKRGRPPASKPAPVKKFASPEKIGTINVEDVIVAVVPNPKRDGTASWERYNHYRCGVSVRQVLSDGLTMGDIKHDLARNYITLEPAK